MAWYWLLLAVFILGIGLFIWIRHIFKEDEKEPGPVDLPVEIRPEPPVEEPPDTELPPPDTAVPEPHPRATKVGGHYFPAPASELVEFAAFVPRDVRPGSYFMLDIWAYLPSDYNFVNSIAKELSRDINVSRKIGIPISRGTLYTIMIQIPSFKIDDPVDTLTWHGKPANATYIIEVPDTAHIGTYPGKAAILFDGITIAKLKFLISVASISDSAYIDRSIERKFVKTAFASYARENLEEVLPRIQGMKKVAPELDVFLDVFALRSGQNWQAKLKEHVPTKDIFYLFWSQYAACSEWVEKEWRLALGERGLEYIDPVPLVDPDDTPPPRELNALHFMDAYVGYMKYLSLKNTIEKNH